MYINTTYLIEKGYDIEDVITLSLISQKDGLLLTEERKARIPELVRCKLLHFNTKISKETGMPNLTQDGKAFLHQVSTQDYSENIGRLTAKLQTMYQEAGAPDHRLGKEAMITDLICWFLSATPFSLTDIYEAIEDYIGNISSPDYLKTLDRLFWDKPNDRAIHWNLRDSELFAMICRRKGLSLNKVIDNTDKGIPAIRWVAAVVNHQIPKGLPDDMYFTGSYKTDVSAKKRIQHFLFNLFR